MHTSTMQITVQYSWLGRKREAERIEIGRKVKTTPKPRSSANHPTTIIVIDSSLPNVLVFLHLLVLVVRVGNGSK
ncbi:hypothetical protein IE53DRAFT_389637 [Violaceomyces palustris]|uniref:Uncharacterized protein n=1 Tax=Violaceomyces palustris TaxID=1673888 RepID=A0ACD0NQQ6_9BASI|nr:hypothetical protein IE53DRAFT_389637 [Violaceomyces palustris]